MKRSILFILCALLLTSCKSSKVNSSSLNSQTESSKESVSENKEKEEKEEAKKEEKEEEKDVKDDEMGLYTKKIGQVNDLTEEQKRIIQYFDNDYFVIRDYEFMGRYPQIFRNAQVHQVAEVSKILEATDTEYTAIAAIFDTTSYIAEREQGDQEAYLKNKIIVKGKQPNNMRVLEGDIIRMYGRYVDIDSSNNLPVIDLYENTLINGEERFSPAFIKKVAETIFGKNIEVRNAIMGQDYADDGIGWKFAYDPYMICTLENSTNSKFTSFRFYTERGSIDDAKSASSEPMLDLFQSNIERTLEFAPDLKHYFMFTFNRDLNSLSIDYYDLEFNKIWNREFGDIKVKAYDYTNKAIYLSINNDFYMIDLETGEDKIAPIYLGEKVRVSKVKDGVILIANSSADTVMKLGLDGEILWKVNTSFAPDNIDCLQFVKDNIIISINDWSYIIVNATTGELVQEISEPNNYE